MSHTLWLTYLGGGADNPSLTLVLEAAEPTQHKKAQWLLGAILKRFGLPSAIGTEKDMARCPLCQRLSSQTNQNPATDGSPDPKPPVYWLRPDGRPTSAGLYSSGSIPGAVQE